MMGPIVLGLLAAFGLIGWISSPHFGVAARSTQASLLEQNATPMATPLPAGPFELPGAVPVSLVIQNAGADDRLLGGRTCVASRVALHRTRLVEGRRVMEPAPDGFIVPAGETRIFEPAVEHLMLVGLREDLIQGQTFPLTLAFEQAGEVTITVRVRRKVDAAGIKPIPPDAVGDLVVSLASAPPAPAAQAQP